VTVANPYEIQISPLAEVIDETPTIKTFVFTPEEPIRFRAGQFVQVTVPGLGEAPFTPSSSPHEPERLAVTVLRTGLVTDRMHACRPGDRLGLRGPFGKGYPLEKLEGKDVLVVGGGVGLAPLRALILALLGDLGPIRRLSIKYGAREPAELLYTGEYDAWTAHEKVDMAVTVDRGAAGWTGRVGLVTTLLEKDGLGVDIANTVAFSCGPGIMLKFVTARLLEIGFQPEQIYLSMNRRMSCGIGKCGRCNIGPYYLCKDGPDMNYAQIMGYANVF
jgi:NAD(P)H-flavin reductase